MADCRVPDSEFPVLSSVAIQPPEAYDYKENCVFGKKTDNLNENKIEEQKNWYF